MRRATRGIATVLAALTIVGLSATAAWAPKYLSLFGIDGSCSLGAETGSFSGQIFITEFTSDDGTLLAAGEVTGSCDLPSGEVTLSQTRSFVEITVAHSDCGLLELALDDGVVRNGMTLDLGGDVAAFQGGNGTGRLCAISHQLDRPADQLAQTLTTLLLGR